MLRLLPLALVLAACSSSQPSSLAVEPLRPDAPSALPILYADASRSPSGTPRTVAGTWQAVEVADDPVATRDLREGVLIKTLFIHSDGRAVLHGEDVREGGGRVAFDGRIAGNALRLTGLPGEATLSLRDDRLHVLDPGGTTTVYARRAR